MDIVARVDEPEIAGLSGFAGVQGDRLVPFKTAAAAFDCGWEEIIDLSKVPASAIVTPPVPEAETRKVRLALFSTGEVCQWNGAFPTVPANPAIVAFVERDITFTHGEGLSDESSAS